MGYFELYDYTSVFTKAVNAALFNPTDLNAITPGSFIYGGKTFNVTKTLSSNTVIIGIQCPTYAYPADDILGILDAAGLRNENLAESIFPWDDFKLGFDSNRTDPPYFEQAVSGGTCNASFIMPSGYSSRSATLYLIDHGTSAPIAIPINDSQVAIGWITFYSHDWENKTFLEVAYYPSWITDNWNEAPGDKGFRPTAARTNKDHPGIGGRGTANKKDPQYPGDHVTQPGAPDESQASAVGSGFINCYKIDTANLQKVGQCLYGSTLLGLLQSLSINPLDFIISLMVFPTNPDVGASENIKLGGWLAAAAGGAALGFDASGNKLASQFKVVDFGTLQIPENWGSFLDYESQIELYLPFIGTVNIDVSECMGGSINVQYTIDFFTGMCVANVLCSKPAFVLPSGKVISNVEAQHAYQGNCAIQIPLSAINYGNMVGSLINACTQGITNPVAGMINAGETALSGGFRPSVTSKGNIVANSGFCSVLYPYIRITRPITAEPESFQEVLGYPSYINTTLGECEGLCVCEDIDIEGIVGATENELTRIKNLCSEGIYV